VEALQRLLNARLRPSPGLGVDGDFGAATHGALVRFQESHGLKATGTTDPETWKALGPLPPPEPEPPAPEVVNAAKPAKRPADSLDGPPFTTSKAWAVADGETGALIAGHRADEPLDMASTTKIMTAYVVLKAAKAEPTLLGESVTFSRRADRTPGSTSGVREGESLPLRELMYGLLLPSGNDASVALGEHVGGRFEPAEGGDSEDGLARFVAEMNREAGRLGLKETHFANTHGLTAPGHHTSARDLAKLAAKCLDDPIFAEVVGTQKHGCRLSGPEGTGRNVVWQNTNNLLAIEGYTGVKTGTTGAAGACLVASGERDGTARIVVILGASSSDGRYVDARNLFRWAWRSKD
jgi:D-alanyl-D-alanine carboxypeptidase (penicillin-binding protein 5/6)